jgi:murein DD-endopeptidase MepM/ murein hydrolase activator NlpD
LKTKKRKTKYFTFLLIPDNERATRSIKIRTTVMRFFLVMLAVTFLLILAGAVTYWRVAELALDYNNLLEENVQLKKNLSRLEELQADIDKLKQVDKKLRSSLSGYVTLIEENNSDPERVLSSGIESMGSIKYEQSIFNSIPAEIPVDGFITRGFETSSILSNAHIGIDIAAEEGSPVKSTADGIVIFSDWTFKDGYVVIIKHKFNIFSFYKHNMQNLCQEMEYVKRGQAIALLGGTGQITSGVHLHFEIWEGPIPIDPHVFLQMN